MEKFKNTFSGIGMYGIGMGGVSFGWNDWVTTMLLWALMISAIIAVVKYISGK